MKWDFYGVIIVKQKIVLILTRMFLAFSKNKLRNLKVKFKVNRYAFIYKVILLYTDNKKLSFCIAN